MGGPRVDGRTARWAGHREQRRAEFVEAALVVLERVGPAATVEEFAAELGVTRQALYRQFDDRRDLDHAIAERAAAMLVGEVLPHLAVDASDGVDVDAAVHRVLGAYLDHVQAHLSLYRFVRAHEAEVAADSAVRQVKETVGGRIAALAEQVLGGLDLDLPPQAAQTFATGIIGMTDAVVSRWLEDPRGLERTQLVDQLALMVAGAVRGVTG